MLKGKYVYRDICGAVNLPYITIRRYMALTNRTNKGKINYFEQEEFRAIVAHIEALKAINPQRPLAALRSPRERPKREPKPAPPIYFAPRCIGRATGVDIDDVRFYLVAAGRQTVKTSKGKHYRFDEHAFNEIVAEIRELEKLCPGQTPRAAIRPCSIQKRVTHYVEKQRPKLYYTVSEVSDVTGVGVATIRRFCNSYLGPHERRTNHRFDEERYRQIVTLFLALKKIHPHQPLRAYYRLKGRPPVQRN